MGTEAVSVQGRVAEGCLRMSVATSLLGLHVTYLLSPLGSPRLDGERWGLQCRQGRGRFFSPNSSHYPLPQPACSLVPPVVHATSVYGALAVGTWDPPESWPVPQLSVPHLCPRLFPRLLHSPVRPSSGQGVGKLAWNSEGSRLSPRGRLAGGLQL